MNEEVEAKKKKWPKEYHATAYELTLRQLRSCSPAKAQKAGCSANPITIKPQ